MSRFLSIPQWSPFLRLQDTQTGPEISTLLKRRTGNIIFWKEPERLTLLKGTGISSNDKKFHNSNKEDRKCDFCWREPEYQLPWTEPEISTLLKRTGNINSHKKNLKYQLNWKLPKHRNTIQIKRNTIQIKIMHIDRTPTPKGAGVTNQLAMFPETCY